MEIDQIHIEDMNSVAERYNEKIGLVGSVDVKVGEHIVRNNNFGFGKTYKEALENLKRRCSRTDDMNDAVDVEVKTVYIGDAFYMGVREKE